MGLWLLLIAEIANNKLNAEVREFVNTLSSMLNKQQYPRIKTPEDKTQSIVGQLSIMVL
jgi:hypothetical protein